MSGYEEWSPGHRGWGFLVRCPEDEELCLALYAYEGECNPLRLILYVGNLYAIDMDGVDRLIDYILVTEGGYLTLPLMGPTELSRPQIAEEIMSLDHRLAWQEDRWRFE